MKLLIITYSYTPDLTPRAFRWAAVAAELAVRGHEVHVLCAAAPVGGEVCDGVIVHRVRDWLLNGSARVGPGVGSADVMPVGGLRILVRRYLRKTIRALWRALYWPDYACGWVFPAVSVARALQTEKGFDWIISSSHPFTSHLVGLLAKRHAPAARWLVDIGDPFYPMKEPSPNNRMLYRWLNRAVEAHVVTAADAVSVTTVSTQNLYIKCFGLAPCKVQVVPPLISLPAVPPRFRSADDTTLQLVFVGTLYRKLRSPRFLLACFSALQVAMSERPMELHFYGALNDCADDFANYGSGGGTTSVFVHGMVSRAEVLQAMINADVLVNIGNDSDAQLASKVIEYMAVGKPILNLPSSLNDASLSALADYPAVLNLPRANDSPSRESVEALRNFMNALPAVPEDAVEAVRRKYAASHVSTCYEMILNQLTVPK